MSGLGKRLAEERKRLGLSQSAFADLVGVSFSSQRRYEDGRSAPDTGYLDSLRKHGVDADFVLSGDTHSDRQSDHIIHALIKLIERIGDRIGSKPEAIAATAYFPLETPEVFEQGGLVPDQVIEKFFDGCRLDIDGEMLASVIEQLDALVRQQKVKISPRKKAQAVAMLYRAFKGSGQVDQAMIDEAVKLAAT